MTEFYAQDDDQAFWETMGQESVETPEAEAAPEEGTPAEEVAVEETPVEVEAETVAEQDAEKPRDDKGRFVKQETVEEAQERLLAGKFKNPEELEQAYAELQSRFGSQGSELGELRRTIEDRFAGLEQAVNRPQATQSWDDLIEENPARAMALAVKEVERTYDHERGASDSQSLYLFQQVKRAWDEISPGASDMWLENYNLRQEVERRLAHLDQRTQPVVQQAEGQASARAYLNVKNKFPDIDQYIDKMQEVSVHFPLLVTAVETGTQEEREQAWEALLFRAKAGAADTLQKTAQQVARSAADAEQRVREEAAVASAATVPGEKKKNLADRIGAEWDEIENPLAAGWNI